MDNNQPYRPDGPAQEPQPSEAAAAAPENAAPTPPVDMPAPTYGGAPQPTQPYGSAPAAPPPYGGAPAGAPQPAYGGTGTAPPTIGGYTSPQGTPSQSQYGGPPTQGPYPPQAGRPTPPPPKSGGGAKIAAIVLACLLVVAIVLNVVQLTTASALRNQLGEATTALEDAQASLSSAQSQLDTMESDLTWAEENIAGLQGDVQALQQENSDLQAALAEGGGGDATGLSASMVYLNLLDFTGDIAGGVYHEAGCPLLDAEYYMGLPRDLVSFMGLTPCPECH